MKNRITKVFSFVVLALLLVCCNDSKENDQFRDPNKTTEFTDFRPKEGRIRTRLYIIGENFGTDISKIKVNIGGEKAPVIGSNGKEIYCMVPRHAYNGIVEVIIYNENNQDSIKHTFDETFEYTATSSVGTLCGKVDPITGVTSIIDGPFDEVEFESPSQLLIDTNEEGETVIYVMEQKKALRRINLAKEEVQTVFTNGQGGFRNLFTMTFNAEKDTLFLTDDHGQNNNTLPVISYALKSENFRRVYPYVYGKTGYCAVAHPIDRQIFWGTWWDSAMWKAKGTWDEDKKIWLPIELYPTLPNKSAHMYMMMHPTGEYTYIMAHSCIMKALYDKEKQELLRPIVHVGNQFNSGYSNAPGTQAQFGGTLYQGVFVKNEEYVNAGKKDIYDFYVCDQDNHCVRIVTPDGEVRTFAGRGSPTPDGKVQGYIDGDVRKEARFDGPSGITYDEETKTFYVAEWWNRRIRTISVE